jgi:hypothetical protein
MRLAGRWRSPPTNRDPVPDPQLEQGSRRAGHASTGGPSALRKRSGAGSKTQPNLTLFQQAVDDLTLEGEQVTGVVTRSGFASKRIPWC